MGPQLVKDWWRRRLRKGGAWKGGQADDISRLAQQVPQDRPNLISVPYQLG